jgi:putative membrane protein
MPDPDNPYSLFTSSELILRDQLAIDRTVLANKRTFLAYVRTALAFLVVGGSLVKFFDSIPAIATGYVFILFAAGFLFIGIRRYRIVQRQIAAVRRK